MKDDDLPPAEVEMPKPTADLTEKDIELIRLKQTINDFNNRPTADIEGMVKELVDELEFRPCNRKQYEENVRAIITRYLSEKPKPSVDVGAMADNIIGIFRNDYGTRDGLCSLIREHLTDTKPSPSVGEPIAEEVFRKFANDFGTPDLVMARLYRHFGHLRVVGKK